MPREHNIPGSVHPVENECLFMFTMVPNSNGKRYRVRCACMAQIKMPRDHNRLYFYVFDDLGTVRNLWQGRFVWSVHLALKHAQAVEKAALAAEAPTAPATEQRLSDAR